MTPAEQKCLDAIARLSDRGVSPSFDELRLFLGLKSKSGVHRMVHALAARGYISIASGKRRTIQIVSRQAEEVPFERMAAAAVLHVIARTSLDQPITISTMRAALVRAFTSDREIEA